MTGLLFPLISIAPGPPDEILDIFPAACDISLFVRLCVTLRATKIESTLRQKQCLNIRYTVRKSKNVEL